MYVSERAVKSGSKHVCNMHFRDLLFIDLGVSYKIGNTKHVFVSLLLKFEFIFSAYIGRRFGLVISRDI